MEVFIMGVMLCSMFLFLVVLIVAAIIYVMKALCLQAGLKQMGYQNAWMAWIPFLDYIALACVTERDESGNVDVVGLKIPGQLFNFWVLVSFLVGFIPGIGTLASLAVQVLCLGTSLKFMYAKALGTTPEEEKTIAFVSGVFPFIIIFKMWKHRKVVVTTAGPTDPGATV